MDAKFLFHIEALTPEPVSFLSIHPVTLEPFRFEVHEGRLPAIGRREAALYRLQERY